MRKRNYQAPKIASIRMDAAPLLSASNGISTSGKKGDQVQYSKGLSFDFDEDEE